jgi:hypothetical protein
LLFIFAAEQPSEDEDDPGLEGPDMEESLLSPASLIQLEDSVGPGNDKSYFNYEPKIKAFTEAWSTGCIQLSWYRSN